jgi:hypothetical protein
MGIDAGFHYGRGVFIYIIMYNVIIDRVYKATKMMSMTNE